MRNIYETAFNSEMSAFWFGTKFQNEIPLLSLARALTCWLYNSDLGIESRQKLVYTYLSTWFSTEKDTDELVKAISNIPTENEVIKRVVDNVCYLYNQPPQREFQNLSDKQKEYLDKILKQSLYNHHIAQAMKLMWLSGECAIRPRQKNGKWWWEVLSRDMYRYVADVDGTLQEFWIPFQNPAGKIFYHYWTPETYTQLDTSGRNVKFEYNGEMVTEVRHKYKNEDGEPIIPYVILKSSFNEDVFGGGQWELVRAQIQLNLINYLIEENLIYGTTGFWFAKNLVDYVKSTTLSLSPSKIIHVSEHSIDSPISDIEHKSAQMIVLELIEAKNRLTEMILRNYSLPFSAISSNPSLPSGVAMLVDRWELLEKRYEFITLMQKYEKDILKTFVAVNNVESDVKLPFFETSIDYADFVPPYDIDKTIEIYQTLAKEGLITPREYVQKLSSNEFIVSDEDAIQFVIQNKEKFDAIRGNEANFEPNSGNQSNASNDTAEPVVPGVQQAN